MTEIPGIPFYALELVRSRLRYLVLKSIKEGVNIGCVMLDPKRLYTMYWQQAAIITIFRNECDRLGYTISDTEDLVELLMKDIKRLTIIPAAYAWLAVRESDYLDCLNQHGLDEELARKQMLSLPNPESISYGLILKHYTSVYRVVQYLAGFSKDEENILFTKEELTVIRKNTKRNMEVNLKPTNQERFDDQVARLEEDFDPIISFKYSL